MNILYKEMVEESTRGQIDMQRHGPLHPLTEVSSVLFPLEGVLLPLSTSFTYWLTGYQSYSNTLPYCQSFILSKTF